MVYEVRALSGYRDLAWGVVLRMHHHILDSFDSVFLGMFISPEAINLILASVLIREKPPNLWRITGQKNAHVWRTTVNPVLPIRID